MSGPLDVGLALPTQEGLSASDYVELARLGDEEGFHTVTVGEIAGADAFTVLGAIASTTSRIRLGSGIIAIYNRSPVLTAMSFASLESLAPGRVFAGLGTGSHRIVEDWNDRDFQAPLQTMREYVEIFRAVGRGERIDRAGESRERSRVPAPASSAARRAGVPGRLPARDASPRRGDRGRRALRPLAAG